MPRRSPSSARSLGAPNVQYAMPLAQGAATTTVFRYSASDPTIGDLLSAQTVHAQNMGMASILAMATLVGNTTAVGRAAQSPHTSVPG